MAEFFDNILDDFKVQLEEELQSRTKTIVEDFLKDKFSSNDLFSGSAAKTIRDYASSYTSNEIGNRLRCGCYDATLFKRVFDEHFHEEMEKAIKSELQTKIRNVIKEEVTNYMKNIIDKVNKS